jgi:microcompartment protein CcmK/EutM
MRILWSRFIPRPMILCRVVGTAVAPRKDATLRPAKMLVVRTLQADGAISGGLQIALDPGFGAGEGDAVLIAKEGAVSEQLMGQPTPANVIIVAVVEEWAVEAPPG